MSNECLEIVSKIRLKLYEIYEKLYYSETKKEIQDVLEIVHKLYVQLMFVELSLERIERS